MAYTTFKLPIGYRLYDREQNKVVPLNQEEYESLERIQAGRATSGRRGAAGAVSGKKGFCQESELCEIEHPATPTLEAALQTQLRQIVLQVTQNCNLRCSYCAYSGSYYNRTHTNKRMACRDGAPGRGFLSGAFFRRRGGNHWLLWRGARFGI